MSGRWHWFPALLLTFVGHLCMLIGYTVLCSLIVFSLGDQYGNISAFVYKASAFLYLVGVYGIYAVFSFVWHKTTVKRYWQSKLYRYFTYGIVYAARAFYIQYHFSDISKGGFSLMGLCLLLSIGFTADSIKNLQKENE